MVNMPHQGPHLDSDTLIEDIVAARFETLRRVTGAVLLAIIAAAVIGSLLRSVPANAGGTALQQLVPTDDIVAAAGFTA